MTLSLEVTLVALNPPLPWENGILDRVLLPLELVDAVPEPNSGALLSPGLYWIVIPEYGDERASPTSKEKKPTNRQIKMCKKCTKNEEYFFEYYLVKNEKVRDVLSDLSVFFFLEHI